MAKTIIVTGASRGIGMAICRYLLNSGSNVVAVARTEPPLQELEQKYPERVAVLACDLKNPDSGRRAVHLASEKFGLLDGLIVNHGMVEPVERIADASLEEWRSAFDTNVFSVIELIKAALPNLRERRGNIILTSSGAAVKGTSAWGCYSAGKAVYNSLARTLAAEEPDLVTVAIRPGVVNTEMQSTLATNHFETMDKKDADRFRSMKAEGKMLNAEQPGNVIARLAVGAAPALSGQFIDWNSAELSTYQDDCTE